MPVVGSTTPDSNKRPLRAYSMDSDNYVWNDDQEPPEEFNSSVQIPKQMVAEAQTQRGYKVEESYLDSGEKCNERNTAKDKEPTAHIIQTCKRTKDEATCPWYKQIADAATQWST